MNDIVNIRLSKDANDIAERLVATGKFENVVTAAKFALAYALKNHFDECDPSTYSIPDSSGSNYNVGSFDNDHLHIQDISQNAYNHDGKLAALLRAIYPNSDTPYIYARALMVYGLMKIGERIEREGMPSISALCE